MNKKSIVLVSIIAIISVFLFSTVYAASGDVTLEKAEDNVCEIALGKDGKLTKKLISVDNDKKEATLQIDIENLNDKNAMPAEIFLVIDNSKSMTDNKLEDGQTRKTAVFSAAKQLVNNIFKEQNSTTIGVVSFSTNSDSSKEGTIEDAQLILNPTNSATEIAQAIDSIETTGARTNIDAGLQVAKNSFKSGEDIVKFVILLTDGVPNTAVGGPTMTYSGEVTTKTKNTLNSIKSLGINIITVMTGVNSQAQPDPNGATSPEAAGKTYQQLAEEIFGTQTNPTYGKFYYVTDKDVTNTIANTTYADIKEAFNNEITDITMVDYFPDDIIANYDFEIVEKANIGEVTSKVNTENNSITWKIQKLSEKEKASFKYKLKLKENYDEKILNVAMPTNKKVDITYTKGKIETKTSDVSPKIILKGDNTMAPEIIPQTGDTATYIVIGIAILATVSAITIYKIKR